MGGGVCGDTVMSLNTCIQLSMIFFFFLVSVNYAFKIQTSLQKINCHFYGKKSLSWYFCLTFFVSL